MAFETFVGLFQKAISNSGTSLSQWALSRKAPRVAEIVAMLLDIDTSNSSTIVDGLRKVNYGQLQIKAFATQIVNFQPSTDFLRFNYIYYFHRKFWIIFCMV